MREKAQPQRRWPTPDIVKRARFVDTEAVACYLALEAHTLECYRSLGGGPVYHKFGKWVRYAVDDLDSWAKSCQRSTTASHAAPRVLPVDLT
ncbi:DNA-binding protein [Xanthobacter versatilis]|uniref:DNA-binding protein n=1 Tax=Xanthobacter autotrophicus (strain ATCC BAA-1158 / Py2) TaxID=78245 RepID=UPI00372A46ED